MTARSPASRPTNHLGPLLLTCLLVPALRRGPQPRRQSPAGHLLRDVDFDDPNFESRPYDKYRAYAESKTAVVLFTVEFSRRLATLGVPANAVAPGAIMTPLGQRIAPEEIAALMSASGRAKNVKRKFMPVHSLAIQHSNWRTVQRHFIVSLQQFTFG